MKNREKIKRFLKTIGLLSLAHWILKLLAPVKKFFCAFSFYFYNSFLTKFPSYTLRTFYLRKIIGISIGKNTSIHMGCFFAGKNIVIGNNNVIARNCYLDGRVGLITIMNNVSIAPDTCIISLTHVVNSPTFETIAKDIIIQDYAWIGTRAMILPGVTVGKGAVLGAGAIATKELLPYSINVGNPAKEIGKRSEDLHYTLNYFPYFNSDIQ
ncbi:MAG TPA: acyltransferase [Ferruginibacter sp.]|nr:acyltransferase [Ferruginibacter sp.]